MKSKYTLRRRGSFFANLDPCDQCGSARQNTFQFDVEIEAEELDEHGFVLDNRKVPEAFTHWQSGHWLATCEDLASGGLRYLHAALAGRATALTVRITANGDSSIESRWYAGESLPEREPWPECTKPQEESPVRSRREIPLGL